METNKDVFSFPPINNNSQSREIITPHKISVVILIKEQCLLKEKCEYRYFVRNNVRSLVNPV